MNTKYSNNLIDILDFYRKYFCYQNCIIETRYKKINPIQISFEENQLPHLLGLGKVGCPEGARGVYNIEK
ncbi:PBECR4 domain-containing protein [Aerococcus urinaehominis]|uniref:PBECR4 domain-containing protein n=1 Tax=Aerococcus urinaehominis TaxID=128944 RepID=UPI000A66C753